MQRIIKKVIIDWVKINRRLLLSVLCILKVHSTLYPWILCEYNAIEEEPENAETV